MFWMIPLFFILIYGLLIWFFPGLTGGIITAFAIRLSGEEIGSKKFFKIALGWCMGMTIGGIAGLATYAALIGTFTTEVSWKISYIITGMFTGLIGSWLMYRLLGTMREKEQ